MLCVLLKALFVCLVPLSQLTAIITKNSITCLVLIVDLGGVLCETQTEFLQLEAEIPFFRDRTLRQWVKLLRLFGAKYYYYRQSNY